MSASFIFIHPYLYVCMAYKAGMKKEEGFFHPFFKIFMLLPTTATSKLHPL